ncbi:hypothetical protein [Tardiphaga robiniae]|uniref:Uncharacterized protein n=1 Tax=Tardiphaga robiniae TaxID=943830 RepID=A0A7G6TWL5_9BRAD|nr:hypothetical protein [Tardiphaga robiniae]QND71147.1 hypothetical protein HB776_07760 [Tardiphaga robiniae]
MSRIRELAGVLAGETFAICVLAAVVVVSVLAFCFEASPTLVISLLVIGAFTAAGETLLRSRHDKRDKS